MTSLLPLSLLAAALAVAPAPDDFEARLALARQAAAAADGQAYQRAWRARLAAPLSLAQRDCARSAAAAPARSFIVLAQIDGSGHPDHLLVHPVDGRSSCVAAHIGQFEFPVPPLITDARGYPLAIDVDAAP